MGTKAESWTAKGGGPTGGRRGGGHTGRGSLGTEGGHRRRQLQKPQARSPLKPTVSQPNNPSTLSGPVPVRESVQVPQGPARGEQSSNLKVIARPLLIGPQPPLPTVPRAGPALLAVCFCRDPKAVEIGTWPRNQLLDGLDASRRSRVLPSFKLPICETSCHFVSSGACLILVRSWVRIQSTDAHAQDRFVPCAERIQRFPSRLPRVDDDAHPTSPTASP